jgi:beta-mannosidase
LKLEEAPETVFSDNYFDVPAGRTIEISYPIPEGWSSDRAKKALLVYSLYNSFTK